MGEQDGSQEERRLSSRKPPRSGRAAEVPANLWSPHPCATAPGQLASLSSFRALHKQWHPKGRESGVHHFVETVLHVAVTELLSFLRPSSSCLFRSASLENVVLAQKGTANVGKPLKTVSKEERSLPSVLQALKARQVHSGFGQTAELSQSRRYP